MRSDFDMTVQSSSDLSSSLPPSLTLSDGLRMRVALCGASGQTDAGLVPCSWLPPGPGLCGVLPAVPGWTYLGKEAETTQILLTHARATRPLRTLTAWCANTDPRVHCTCLVPGAMQTPAPLSPDCQRRELSPAGVQPSAYVLLPRERACVGSRTGPDPKCPDGSPV